MEITIRTLEDLDLDSVLEIFEEGILTGNATFEKSPPSKIEWDNQHIKAGRLVSVMNDKVIGWAALSPISDRSVYSGVSDVSIYVKQSERGKGIGKKLLETAVEKAREIHTYRIRIETHTYMKAANKLYKSYGFRKVQSFPTEIPEVIWPHTLFMELNINFE